MELTAHDVLRQLCDTIDATDGVAENPHGHYEPYADREWIDLGECYIQACKILRRTPKVTKVDENGDEIDEEEGCEFCDGDGEKPGGVCGACHGEGR